MCEIAACAVGFHPVIEGSDGPLPSVEYPISSQEAAKALMTPLGLQVIMGGGDHSSSVPGNYRINWPKASPRRLERLLVGEPKRGFRDKESD
ncbi:hypothetical protein EVAR_80853_1 [Eumeta japonica]|uniref:Uncharacterized protein n=1 Tax=Eumeta variegata TaxID=151549 RepID=A0A4C1V1D3_EUMVA|nr:hypothetical protein EVAR_80853_1 [Eumeta japonica]